MSAKKPDEPQHGGDIKDPEAKARYLTRLVRELREEKAAHRALLMDLNYSVQALLDHFEYEEYEDMKDVCLAMKDTLKTALYEQPRQTWGKKK